MRGRSLWVILFAAITLACDDSPAPRGGVTISPERVELLVGAGVRFTASVVTGEAVTFSVVEGDAGGSVTAGGAYVAPRAAGEYRVRATSVAEPTRHADAVVTVHGYAHRIARLADPPSARDHHTATLLEDGTVLVVGGLGFEGVVAEADRFDPADGGLHAGGALLAGRMAHAAVRLGDGSVLVTGGWDPAAPGTGADPAFRSSELYDPASGSFTACTHMVEARRHHTMTLLKDGRVLVAGGLELRGTTVATGGTELFDPAERAFVAGPDMVAASGRWLHSATLLQDGRVLIAGGRDTAVCGAFCPNGALATAEIYDPATGSFEQTGSLAVPRHGHSATLLPDGRVLVLGGQTSADLGTGTDQVTTPEIYDPATGTFAQHGTLLDGRAHHALVELNDGTYLLVGGSANGGLPASTTEIFDVASGSSTPGPEMSDLRVRATATKLQSGEVLIVGGSNYSPVWAVDLFR